MAQLSCIGLSWPLTKPPFGSCAIYFHHGVTGFLGPSLGISTAAPVTCGSLGSESFRRDTWNHQPLNVRYFVVVFFK